MIAMRARGTGVKTALLGSLLTLSFQFAIQPSHASPSHNQRPSAVSVPSVSHASARHGVHGRFAAKGHRYAGGGISCVPFARNDSGIDVSGNAWQWWDNAAGVYARGNVPESGSVLTFRANGRMRLGHVAVVSRVINPREVEIEHANWWGPGMYGGVARNIPVVDVSEANDWTAVRVGLGQTGEFGSVYPTYGFIYSRPDNGVMLASNRAPAPQPELNPAPRDLRPAAERGWQTFEEVAEAPVAPRRYRHAGMTARVHSVSTLPERRHSTKRLH
jgi:surface antigen